MSLQRWQPRGRPRPNRRSPQSSGLVLWYPLCSNETAATAQLDCSGRDNHVTTTWSATDTSLAYMPGYGIGMAFSSTGQHRAFPSGVTSLQDSLNGRPWSASFWVRRTGSSTSWRTLIRLSNTSSPFVGIYLRLGGSGTDHQPQVYVGGTGASHFAATATILDKTQHYCIVGNGVTQTWYIDGIQDTSTAYTILPGAATSQPLVFGLGSSSEKVTNHILSDIRIYNRALTAKEVYTLYDPSTRFDLFDTDEMDWIINSGPTAAGLLMAEDESGGGGSGGSTMWRRLVRPITQPIPTRLIS